MIRDNEGKYIAFLPYSKRLDLKPNKEVAGSLKVNQATGTMTYTGGPRLNSAFSIPFEISFKLDVAELRKNWILPAK